MLFQDCTAWKLSQKKPDCESIKVSFQKPMQELYRLHSNNHMIDSLNGP